MAMNFQKTPRPVDAPGDPRDRSRRALETVLGGLSPARAVDDPSAPRDRRRDLWVGILVMVISFWRGRRLQLSSAIDEISGSARAPPPPTKRAEARIHELESRIAGYENKLVPIERSFAQLRQRHSDLQKAYNALRATTVQAAFARHPDAVPSAAP
jgi:hypothetical protein